MCLYMVTVDSRAGVAMDVDLHKSVNPAKSVHVPVCVLVCLCAHTIVHVCCCVCGHTPLYMCAGVSARTIVLSLIHI